MAVHDIFAELLLASQEFFANPEQIALRLLGQWDARAYAGVNEEEVSATEAQPQIDQELQMFGRHCANQIAQYRCWLVALQVRRSEPVGHQCLGAADGEPILEQ